MQVPFYWSAQVSGAVIAGFVLRELLHPIANLGTTTPSGTVWQALVTEVVVTFNMMFVTSAVATDTKAVNINYCLIYALISHPSRNFFNC